MENKKMKKEIYQDSRKGRKRREMLRKCLNQCYQHNIKNLKDPKTLECSFELAYDLFHYSDVYK